MRTIAYLTCYVVLFSVGSSASAAIITYSSEAAFQAATPGLAGFESFEGQTATNLQTASTQTLANLTFTHGNGNNGQFAILSVWNSPLNGLHATDGTKWLTWRVGNPAPSSLVIDITGGPVKAFGFMMSDVLDTAAAAGQTIKLTTDTGFTTTMLTGPAGGFADGSEHFFGIVSDVSFSKITLTDSLFNDTIAFDEFRYGTTAEAVPEPATLTIWTLSLAGCAVASWRRKRSL